MGERASRLSISGQISKKRKGKQPANFFLKDVKEGILHVRYPRRTDHLVVKKSEKEQHSGKNEYFDIVL